MTESPNEDTGLMTASAESSATGAARAVFIDRDGTLISLVPYLHDPALVRLLPGAAEALRRLQEAGFMRILVTNQSGIARGMYGMDAVESVHARVRALLRAEGADLEGVEVCPHLPEITGPCDCRKPSPGMIVRASRSLGIDPGQSWVIGDRLEDVASGKPVGCPGILVLTGYGREVARVSRPEQWENVRFVAWDLSAAVTEILRR
jgi:D-glycero-D-manno-heptose 1,7-bisphosphate phosphatase